jgi:hypothetical protein
MKWLSPIPENIPPELRAMPWVLWRGEDRGGPKPSKVPYCIADPRRRASSTDPGTWGTFDDALDALSITDADGVGVVLTRADGLVCIDLDGVVTADGQVDVRAQTIVDRCASWTEISPSGTGLHIFVRGQVPRGLRGAQIEVYSTERYIAVTGRSWPATPDTICDQQAYPDHLTRLEAQSHTPRTTYTGPSVPPPDDLAGALLAKLQTMGLQVTRLKPWSDGYLVELVACPWASEHTSGPGGAAVAIHASGAFDFMCLHAHCGGRDWRDFRAAMGGRA